MVGAKPVGNIYLFLYIYIHNYIYIEIVYTQQPIARWAAAPPCMSLYVEYRRTKGGMPRFVDCNSKFGRCIQPTVVNSEMILVGHGRSKPPGIITLFLFWGVHLDVKPLNGFGSMVQVSGFLLGSQCGDDFLWFTFFLRGNCRDPNWPRLVPIRCMMLALTQLNAKSQRLFDTLDTTLVVT